MKNALIINVGGSDEPVVICIKETKPDFIYFICSGGTDKKKASTHLVDGEGNVCERVREIKCPDCGKVIQEGKKLPNIIIQSGYKGEYKKIELEDPDNFSEVFQKIINAIKEAKDKNFKIITDFTAGTKTMTSALAIASALDEEIEPYLVKGIRENTIKTTKSSALVNIKNHIESVRIEIYHKIIDKLLEKKLYYPSYLIIYEILKSGISSEFEKNLREKMNICYGFYNWDRFDYENAYEILKNYANKFEKEFKYLLKILKKDKNTGYEVVFDLISNAKKQADLGYFDNAVARVYRALELFAQIRLKNQYGIETSHLEESLDKLKNKERWEKKRNEEEEIKIGLNDDYEVLLELQDPIGKLYEKVKKEFIEKLKIRNNSKLAHGDIPVKKEDWDLFFEFFSNFIEECAREIKVKIEEISLPTKI